MLREIVHFVRHAPEALALKLELPQAELYDTLMTRIEAAGMRARRAELARGLRGDVLEIGCGTGLMFEHYEREARVVALEPDPDFLARAEDPARRARATISRRAGSAESVPLPSQSVDAVVIALVLCSVRSVDGALAEVRRVLRPGGEVRLCEHVISRRRLPASLMHAANPLWRLANGQGCNMNRDAARSLEAAGFEVEASAPFQMFAAGLPAFPHVMLRAWPR